MAFPKSVKELCTPAYIYFILSLVGIIFAFIHNIGNTKVYSLGYFKSKVPNTTLVFIIKFLYILFWTWILNLICKDGHGEIAWFLVLAPFITLFLIAITLMVE